MSRILEQFKYRINGFNRFDPSRRDFLKKTGTIGLFFFFGGGAEIWNIFSKETDQYGGESKIHKDQQGVAIEFSPYPASKWVFANTIRAAHFLNQAIISPDTNFSLIDTIKFQNFDENNNDPNKNYVYGYDERLNHLPGAGLCKPTTDIFRLALSGPVEIIEASTHVHPYLSLFDKTFSLGTDAGIYVPGADEEGKKFDLRLHNPFDVPIRITYEVYVGGEKLNVEKIMKHKLNLYDYFTSIIGNAAKFLDSKGIPYPKGRFPNDVGQIPMKIKAKLEFINPDHSQWSTAIKNPTDKNGKYILTRALYENNEQVGKIFKLISQYPVDAKLHSEATIE